MKYEIGDRIPNGEAMIRRIRIEWIKDDKSVSREAFRPKVNKKGQLEDGVSVDLKSSLTAPIGNDYWSNKRKMATGQFLSDTINAFPSYEIIYNGPSPSHCIIVGNMSVLFDDLDTLSLMAMGVTLIHIPITYE